MEDKFCLKSRKELDEIRKQKAEVKKQVNEISNKLVGRAGRKIDQQYYQAKGEEIEAADKLSRGTGDMGTLIKASQKADNKLARANRFWKLADKRKARKQVGESKMNEGVTKSNYNEIIKTLSDTLAKAAKENPDARLVKNYQATRGSHGVYVDEGLHFTGKEAVFKAIAVSEKLQEAMKKYGFKEFRGASLPYQLGNEKASSIICFGMESQGDNGATAGYCIEKSNLKFLESKINEISDETVYNAVAKAQDKALKSLRKDPDKRNFLRDAEKLNNIYNAGLRREWRKKGLKNPVGMSAKQLGKVWDKDYEPVKDEYEKQLKKRNKIDAFGNEKNESLTANDWREKLNGDEFVTLKDGREGTLGGIVYDKDNNFVGYEFSTNPYGDYEYEEIKPEDITIASLPVSEMNEGAGSAVIFEFEKADFNIPKVEDNQVIAEVEDLTLASAYDRREAPNGGFIVFDLDQVKAATIKTYNEYDRLVDEPELTVEDIADVKYVSVETMPNLSYSWGWLRIELPKDVVLTWDKYQANYYMPELEVIFTDKAGEEYRVNTVNVDGEYHISEDVYYAYQDLDNYEDEEYDESLTAKKALAKSRMNEGTTGVKVLKDTIDDIEFMLVFDNGKEDTEYYVECYLVGDDTDTYSVRVYDGLHHDVNPHNDNEVMNGLFDSDGGSFDGMEVEIGENDYNFDHMGELEDLVLDVLFNERNGLITKYQEELSDKLAESKINEADKRLTVPNRPRLKSLADDIVDLGVETAKSVGHALTGDIFRKRRKPVVSEARLKELANKGKTEMKNKNFTASEALELSKKHLEERKTRSHRRKAMVEAKSKKMPKGDLILNLVHQVTKNDKGESALIKYDWDKKEYNIEDQETGEILVSGKPNAIIKWAESKGAKRPAKEPGFAIDGAETLDQVYARNWNRAMSKMAKNESKISEKIQGNNLNSKWVIRAWVDNMDSEDGYDEIEFTKIGLIDFINSEEEDYYGDSYDYQTEPVEYDITDEELKTAINDNVFAWVFGDTASVVSIDGKPVNEALDEISDETVRKVGNKRRAKLNNWKDDEKYYWKEYRKARDTFDKIDKNTPTFTQMNTPEYRRAEQEFDYADRQWDNARTQLSKAHDKYKNFNRLDMARSMRKFKQNESMFNKYGEPVDPKEWAKKEARGLNEAKSNEVNIFLTNLGKYNEGELVGEWVKLPVDDFQPILDRIGINDEYEEWFITDYEAPFEINEYDNIEELNDIAREIQDFDSTQLEVLDAYKDNGYDMRDAIDKVIENDYFYLEGDTEEDLAYSYIDMVGNFEDAVSKEDKQYYFDYEAYGRDLVLGGDYSYVDDVVDLNSFADKDTAIAIFGDYGEDLPSEDDIARYKKWIGIYNNYTDEQEEELAKQGIEVFMSSIYVDGVAYDVETLEQVVDEDYEVQSGYKDDDGNIVNVSSEKELAEYIIDDMLGGVDQMSEDELERYFDYAWWGKTLAYDFYKTDNGWVRLD